VCFDVVICSYGVIVIRVWVVSVVLILLLLLLLFLLCCCCCSYYVVVIVVFVVAAAVVCCCCYYVVIFVSVVVVVVVVVVVCCVVVTNFLSKTVVIKTEMAPMSKPLKPFAIKYLSSQNYDYSLVHPRQNVKQKRKKNKNLQYSTPDIPS